MRYSDERILLVSNSHFIFERIDLAANASWRLDAERETWLLVLNGSARAGSISVASGDAIFAQSDDIKIKVGSTGVVALVAYKGMGGPVPHLLNLPVSRISKEKGPTEAAQLPP